MSDRTIQGRGVGIGLGVGCGFGVGWGFGGGNLGLLGLGVGGGCGLGIGLGWGVGVGWGSKYINQHFVFEETKTSRRLNDDSPQVRNPVTSLVRGVKSTFSRTRTSKDSDDSHRE